MSGTGYDGNRLVCALIRALITRCENCRSGILYLQSFSAANNSIKFRSAVKIWFPKFLSSQKTQSTQRYVRKYLPSIRTSIFFPVHVTPGSGYSFSDFLLVYLKTGLWQGEREEIKMQLMEIFFHFNSDFCSPQFFCLSDGQLCCLFNLTFPTCSLYIWSTLLVMECKWWRFHQTFHFDATLPLPF